ncbi:hypothetical protein EVA_06722 [gut metagenome]|uniref:Uncharacterized protein n=1 Tax=gut metagenome TaxID=749906 RepID=J9CY45_9ZZZZ
MIESFIWILFILLTEALLIKLFNRTYSKGYFSFLRGDDLLTFPDFNWT